jgi:hypothetical protein
MTWCTTRHLTARAVADIEDAQEFHDRCQDLHVAITQLKLWFDDRDPRRLDFAVRLAEYAAPRLEALDRRRGGRRIPRRLIEAS